MEITVGGSAIVDVATREDLAEHHRRLEDLIPRKPRGKYFEITAAGSTPAGFTGSGPIAIVFNPPMPPAGRIWFLQWVAVFLGGSPAGAAVSSLNAAVMKGREPQGPGGQILTVPGALSMSDVIIPAQAVPASINVPDKTVCQHNSSLYVVLAGSGLAASTSYVANAGVIEVDDLDEAYFW